MALHKLKIKYEVTLYVPEEFYQSQHKAKHNVLAKGIYGALKNAFITRISETFGSVGAAVEAHNVEVFTTADDDSFKFVLGRTTQKGFGDE